MTPPDWNVAVEIHPAEWRCPTAPFWVAGWARSKSGLIQRDVRARFGERIFLGLCGLPHPSDPSRLPPGSGISFFLDPVFGATELSLEICDQYGRWATVFHQRLVSPELSQPAQIGSTVAEPDTGMVLDLLRAKGERPHEPWRTLADEIAHASRAEFIDIMPSEPFKGALEQLETRVAVHYDHVIITGWVAHRTMAIVRLHALLDTAHPVELLHGLDRPDAAEMFADFTNARHSRFAGHIRVPSGLPRPLALRIFAETPDGQCTLVFLKRIQPVVVSGAGRDLPSPSRWMLWQAARTFNRTLWDKSWRNPAWHSFLRQTWAAWRARAPSGQLPSPRRDSPSTQPARRLRLTLVSHNLNYEGAPLFLLELARHLHARSECEVSLVAAADGPLRERFNESGIPVTVEVPDVALATADNDAFDQALSRMSNHPVWAQADLIITNTLVAFWAVPLARRLGKSSVFYIHESAGAQRFFALDFTPTAIARVEAAIADADRVVFPAADGQRAHAYLADRGQFRALAGWVDVARIESWRKTQDRTVMRQQLGLSPEAVVFAHIGSILARKGVHVYVEAIRQFIAAAPRDKPVVFLLVGAKEGPDPYADLVKHAIAQNKNADIRVIPQSPEPYRWFYATDVFVCASLEEVFPRVVLEAAVFGRSIVSTNVNGIPEMLGHSEAWLVPPDDPAALARGMRAAYSAHCANDNSKGECARRRVTTSFDSAIMLPRHTDLILSAVATF